MRKKNLEGKNSINIKQGKAKFRQNKQGKEKQEKKNLETINRS